MKKIILAFFFVLPLISRSQVITTFAGSGADIFWGGGGYGGDGGPASAALFDNPNSVAADRWGNVYIADEWNLRIRKVDANGIITTVAGSGNEGLPGSGDGGPAVMAPLQDATWVAVDKYGNIYIAEYYGSDVRKVDTAGIITTLAGNGTEGNSGDGGPATAAQLYGPSCVAADDAGNVYISQWGGDVVRKVSPDGIISTIAGTGSGGYNGEGLEANVSQLYGPTGLAFSHAGNLCIADGGNSRVRMINSSGILLTVAGDGNNRFAGNGCIATHASMSGPSGVVFDTAGNMYITSDYRVRMVGTNGIITTIAGNGGVDIDSGDGGPAIKASIIGANGIAVDPMGNIYVAEPNSNIVRKITAVPLTALGRTCSIYPNPAQSVFTISSNEVITGISITDLLGQVVYKAAYNSKQVQVNVAMLPPAMYFVRVNNTWVSKLVKK